MDLSALRQHILASNQTAKEKTKAFLLDRTVNVLKTEEWRELIAGVPEDVKNEIGMLMSAGNGTLQHGSPEEGSLFATVQMEYKSNILNSNLLVDSGCDMDINISGYKAAQLGLPFDDKVVQLEMGQSQAGKVCRRGAVKTMFLLEGEGSSVIDDPLRNSYLEVWTDVGTGDSGNGTTAISNLSQDNSADASPAALTIRVVSPFRNGKDRKGFDAILGSRGMSRLSVGINKDTGRLYVRRRTCHRK